MHEDFSRITLFQLVPEVEESRELALHHAGQLAELLNTDEALPEAIRGPSPRSDISPEHFLSHTREWCKAKQAMNFAVLLDGSEAIGNMSLSHIDLDAKTARTGCFLSNQHQGKGYAVFAFVRLLDKAKGLGITRIAGEVPDAQLVDPDIWGECGVKIGFDKTEVQVSLA